MSHSPTTAPPPRSSPGRGLFWAGLGLCLLGIVATAAQFGTRNLGVPWYAPALATLGALLLLVAAVKRPGIVRVLALLLVTSLAGFEWFFLVKAVELPAYEGPAQAGEPFPAFATTLADGRPFASDDLRDGSRRVMVFFRGRW